MTAEEKAEIKALGDKIDVLCDEVKALRPLAVAQAVQAEQIGSLKAFIQDVNTRQWWLIGVVVTSLLGVVVKICIG